MEYKFEIKDNCELKGNTVKFVLKVSGFGTVENPNGVPYEIVNIFGKAKFDDGYLIVNNKSLKYHHDFKLPREFTSGELEKIEYLLNESNVWNIVVKKLGNKYNN